ncbi:MAG: DUF805 domain-containing protein [Alistipes senegalensis]|nr:DUF805 domain-containing protein [Bacteroides cellulosilyticus]MCM1352600.1 DUF805 domain-containing protein [Alistipes senegalensis]
MNWYLSCLKDHYADFNGRATRTEFWMFVLFNWIASIIIGIIGWALGISWLSTIYGLAVLVPMLAVGARRLHDTGRSGWWWLICLVPVIGFIWLIVLWCLESKK